LNNGVVNQDIIITVLSFPCNASTCCQQLQRPATAGTMHTVPVMERPEQAPQRDPYSDAPDVIGADVAPVIGPLPAIQVRPLLLAVTTLQVTNNMGRDDTSHTNDGS
jgi:hypothetical protein